jgi:hypothetical protein
MDFIAVLSKKWENKFHVDFLIMRMYWNLVHMYNISRDNNASNFPKDNSYKYFWNVQDQLHAIKFQEITIFLKQ